MAIYTELVIACDLPADTPEDVINILQWFIDDPNANPSQIPPGLIYERGLLNGGTPDIPGKAHSILERNSYRKTYELTVRTNSKNLDNEFQKFLDWISQYTLTDGYAGYMRSEIAETPILIYFQEGRVLLKKIVRVENEPFPTDLAKYSA